MDRVLLESEAEQRGAQRKVNEEPMFDLVHGVPGSGKTEIIKWIREMFENVLGWTHGIQFVCIAFQNAVAAHIEGQTIHSPRMIRGQEFQWARRKDPP